VSEASAGGAVSDALLRGGRAVQAPQVTMFLRIDGIQGESTDARHAGEIDVHSFRLGIDNGTTQAGGGTGIGAGSAAGRARFSTVQVGKFYDSASPALLQAAADGRRFPSAVVTFRREGPDQPDVLTYRFTDVVVDEYVQGGREEPPLLERVALDYAGVQVTYQRQEPDGSLGDSIAAGWDLRASRSP